MDEYVKKALETINLEATLAGLIALGGEPLPEEIVTFMRILVKHGCPAKAIFEALPDLADAFSSKK